MIAKKISSFIKKLFVRTSTPKKQEEEQKSRERRSMFPPEETAEKPKKKRRRKRRAPKPKSEEVLLEPVVDMPSWDLSHYEVPVVEGKTRFHELNLPLEIMRALCELNFQYCTPIQAQLIPLALEGKDAAGKAQTGTGKTAAFLINAFYQLRKEIPGTTRRLGEPYVLILAPTRELVMQISHDAEDIGKYCGINTLAVYGGHDFEKQKKALQNTRIDIIAATPGRLMDYMRREHIRLKTVKMMVIDEADRMLDMGFIPDVKTIVYATPPKTERQTLLFSATLTTDVTRLASSWMVDPVWVEIEPEQVAAKSVDQQVYIVTAGDKFALLYNILQREKPTRVIIFANRREGVRRLHKRLGDYDIPSEVLSGSVPQNKRIKTLDRFRSGEVPVLVATDVAGRGLHIEGISHIINYNVPQDPENYVHRIGRTGRAGATGTSVMFACEAESFYLPEIEEYLGHPLTYRHPEDEWLALPRPPRRHERDREKAGEEQGQRANQKKRRRRSRRPSSSQQKESKE